MEKEKKVNALKVDIKQYIKEKNHEMALQLMVDLADHLSGIKMYEAALNEYCKAINYAHNLQDDNPKKFQLVYEADFGYLEILCEADKSRILEVLNAFMLKYPVQDQQMDLIKRQNASHLIAHCYVNMKEYEIAQEYLELSSRFLEELRQKLQHSSKNFEKINNDYEVRESQLYCSYTQIALGKNDDLKSVKDYCEKGLKSKGLEKGDIETYYFLLNVRRTYVPLNERLEISLKLLSTWKKNKKELKSDDGLNAFLCVFHDFVQEKNYEEAEKYLWLAYKEKEINKKSGENAVVKNLVEFFKLRKRIEDVEEMGEEDIENDADICQKYQRIGNGLFNLKCYEVSFGYYLKALQNIIAENLYERKRILKLLVQCLERFAKSEEDYSTLFKYYDEIYEISQSLNSSDIIQIKLNRAISLTKLDICSFEDKQKTLLDIKNELNEDKLLVKYYTAFINMLKLSNGHENEIVQLEEKLKLCQSRVVDVMESNVARDASVDQYDELKIHEILTALEEKFATKEKIETMKKKMFKKDSYGFTEMHKAVKSRKLDEIQFMIEHCGFKDIIDEADAGGKTPLFHAVMNGENEIAEYLIKCEASIDICTTDKGSKDPPGRTALMEAASLGNAALVRLLLDNGANPLLKDDNGKMASFYLSNKLKLCNAALKKRPCPKIAIKEKEQLAKTLSEPEYDELKETQKFLKIAEERKEKQNQENVDEKEIKVESKSEVSEAFGVRKRSRSEVLNDSKRTRKN